MKKQTSTFTIFNRYRERAGYCIRFNRIRTVICQERTIMKQLVIGFFCLLLTSVQAQTYKPVDEGSSVKFTIKNFGFNVSGTFHGLNGTIQYDPAKPLNTSFDVTVDANTINTGIDMRDEHLRSDSYFDVKNYPQIHFVSTRVTTSNKAGTFFVFGNLTIKQTTKEISFPFTIKPQVDAYLFSGEFKMNRRDFAIGGSGTISNDLVVKLEVLTKN